MFLFYNKFCCWGRNPNLQAKIVCILTGNGLKDPDNAIKYSNSDVKKTFADMTEILKAINI